MEKTKTTPVGIRAVDNAGNDYYGAFENILTFTIEGSTASWGSLVDLYGSPLANPVSYLYAVVGFVKYNANGAVPPNPSLVIIKVEDQYGIKADCQVVVTKSDSIVLEIITPNPNAADMNIAATPAMPTDLCTARLRNYTNGNVQFDWSYSVEYSLPTREGEHIFTQITNSTNSEITTWEQDFSDNGQNIFIGRDITINLTAATSDGTYTAEIESDRKIIGENPSPEDARNGVALEYQVIMHHESTFRQFNNGGTPLFGGPNGYGICQIDNPPATQEELWNWQANRSRGVEVFDDKRNWGLGYPERLRQRAQNGQLAPCYLNVTDFTTDEQILKESFQLYNGGHQWTWDPIGAPEDPNTGGQWVPRPGRSGYGDDAWDTYQNPPWN